MIQTRQASLTNTQSLGIKTCQKWYDIIMYVSEHNELCCTHTDAVQWGRLQARVP